VPANTAVADVASVPTVVPSTVVAKVALVAVHVPEPPMQRERLVRLANRLLHRGECAVHQLKHGPHEELGGGGCGGGGGTCAVHAHTHSLHG